MGGLDTLNELEKIEVDNKDRPIEDIIIQKAQVFVDPFQEVDEQLAKDRAEEAEKQQREQDEKEKKKLQAQPLVTYREGVGKYLKIQPFRPDGPSSEPTIPPKKKKNISYEFGDFSSW